MFFEDGNRGFFNRYAEGQMIDDIRPDFGKRRLSIIK